MNLYIATKQNQSPKSKVKARILKSQGADLFWRFFYEFSFSRFCFFHHETRRKCRKSGLGFSATSFFQVFVLFIMKKGGNAGNPASFFLRLHVFKLFAILRDKKRDLAGRGYFETNSLALLITSHYFDFDWVPHFPTSSPFGRSYIGMLQIFERHTSN